MAPIERRRIKSTDDLDLDRPTQLPSAIAISLDKWCKLVAARNLRDVSSLLHPEVVLRSPLGFKPFKGADSVGQILFTVSEVLTNFRYEREFVSVDGCSIALEFSASIADKQLKGVDILRFDENGTITELEITMRPLNSLQALGVAMASRSGVSRFRILLASWLAPFRTTR